MILNNVSPVVVKNTKFKRVLAKPGEGNRAWLKRIMKEKGFDPQGLLLLGGSSVADFHIRVAQSYLRHDLTPSYWSLVGILSRPDTFYSVPLAWNDDLSEMPHVNAVQECNIGDFDDPQKFPNIAFVQFTTDMSRIIEYADKLRWQRSVIDLPELVIRWLEYVWAVGQSGNPLAFSKGLPSAVFAETAFGIGGIELTPGLASASSCPEAIWQAAKWWRAFYEQTSKVKVSSNAASMIPTGCFVMRQPAAAVFEKPFTPAAKTRGKRPPATVKKGSPKKG